MSGPTSSWRSSTIKAARFRSFFSFLHLLFSQKQSIKQTSKHNKHNMSSLWLSLWLWSSLKVRPSRLRLSEVRILVSAFRSRYGWADESCGCINPRKYAKRPSAHLQRPVDRQFALCVSVPPQPLQLLSGACTGLPHRIQSASAPPLLYFACHY